jgi:hypothetical protein
LSLRTVLHPTPSWLTFKCPRIYIGCWVYQAAVTSSILQFAAQRLFVRLNCVLLSRLAGETVANHSSRYPSFSPHNPFPSTLELIPNSASGVSFFIPNIVVQSNIAIPILLASYSTVNTVNTVTQSPSLPSHHILEQSISPIALTCILLKTLTLPRPF